MSHHDTRSGAAGGSRSSSKKSSGKEAQKITAAFFGGTKNKASNTTATTPSPRPHQTQSSSSKSTYKLRAQLRPEVNAIAGGTGAESSTSSKKPTREETEKISAAFFSGNKSKARDEHGYSNSGPAHRESRAMPNPSRFRDATAVDEGQATAMPSASTFRDTTRGIQAGYQTDSDRRFARQQLEIGSLRGGALERQHAWARARIGEMDVCPMGFEWARVERIPFLPRVGDVELGGYRCDGGGHWMSDDLLAAGCPGFLCYLCDTPCIFFPEDMSFALWEPGLVFDE
ncbi:hypothetical protein PVAG01_00321 [Phlyctema vagabunda]|uniref:Uncharacterized protein n=1 Tax=Phlyctema vagabunda TaxID=108571 RepID=A0ABR4PTW6_9HELO